MRREEKNTIRYDEITYHITAQHRREEYSTEEERMSMTRMDSDANERLHLTAWGRGGSPVANIRSRGRAPMRQVKRVVRRFIRQERNMETPTQEQLEITRDFLEFFKDYIERTEPGATVALDSIEEVLSNLPEAITELA